MEPKGSLDKSSISKLKEAMELDTEEKETSVSNVTDTDSPEDKEIGTSDLSNLPAFENLKNKWEPDV